MNGAGPRPVLRRAEEPSGDRKAPGGLSPTALLSATGIGPREVWRVAWGHSRALWKRRGPGRTGGPLEGQRPGEAEHTANPEGGRGPGWCLRR
ncbi:hypothetical protein NDU88_001682 [Pleurodeles waltl]|uniref:Uncharacterized protein n=1 Tax=Pleurodeles waltl TaxID=8319 RepID=A0AAV7L1A5_PLEWA|nr:hypothetical protein NDU88_001682 [Pleurodeles waltl]